MEGGGISSRELVDGAREALEDEVGDVREEDCLLPISLGGRTVVDDRDCLRSDLISSSLFSALGVRDLDDFPDLELRWLTSLLLLVVLADAGRLGFFGVEGTPCMSTGTAAGFSASSLTLVPVE